jgi:hypothetical protein
MDKTERFFRAAGYVFTYRKASGKGTVRIEMWREDPTTRERFWVTMAVCAPDRRAAYNAAMALVAWVRSLDVSPRSDVKAHAVAESIAILNDRLRMSRENRTDPALALALDQLMAGRAAAA